MLSADEFRNKLQAPALIQLFDYWQRVRGDRSMPDWSDIRPEEIAPVLPHIWAWRIDEDGSPRLRLVGERIIEIISRNIRGSVPEDLYPPAEAADVRARILRVATEPVGNFTIGVIYDGRIAVGLGERMALPYAGAHGLRGAIGASRATMGRDPKTGTIIPFKPKVLYRLEGPEYLMRIGVPAAAR